MFANAVSPIDDSQDGSFFPGLTPIFVCRPTLETICGMKRTIRNDFSALSTIHNYPDPTAMGLQQIVDPVTMDTGAHLP